MGSTTEARCSGRGVALGGFSEGGDIQVRKRGTEREETEQGAMRRVFLASDRVWKTAASKIKTGPQPVWQRVQQPAGSKLARAVDSE